MPIAMNSTPTLTFHLQWFYSVGLPASQPSYGIAVLATFIMMASATLSRDPLAYLALSARLNSALRARSPNPPWRPVVGTPGHGIRLLFTPSTWTHGGLWRHHCRAIISSSELSAEGPPLPWASLSNPQAKYYTSSRSYSSESRNGGTRSPLFGLTMGPPSGLLLSSSYVPLTISSFPSRHHTALTRTHWQNDHGEHWPKWLDAYYLQQVYLAPIGNLASNTPSLSTTEPIEQG
mmetsp:Transcript_12208/g.21921  ORF Transcript_12208/g.21921 Transcript_12208/m.21921 type:complete len:234 (-) Transcript_12208:1822-2523(-)